ncbi:sortase [Candidatus Microgenomates bacterium]|nr:sortase [Candidatus Microgenomates bacterium]
MKDILKIFFLRWVGNFLVLSSIAAVVLTFAPAIQAEFFFRKDQAEGVTYVVAGDNIHSSNLFAVSEKVSEINPLSEDFGIVIPKIGANAKVIANVDPGNYGDYINALKLGVAHAKGTAFPGEAGNTYLFAHSVGNFWEVNQWNAVFYLLKELKPGDEVDLFYKGKRYIYIVYNTQIISPEDTQYLSTVSNFPMVTLQTCWPPGTTLKRLLVFGRLKI